jgi:hypothetical protein
VSRLEQDMAQSISSLMVAIRNIELKFDLSFEPPVDATCLMPRVPERPAVLRDDVPIFLYVAGALLEALFPSWY